MGSKQKKRQRKLGFELWVHVETDFMEGVMSEVLSNLAKLAERSLMGSPGVKGIDIEMLADKTISMNAKDRFAKNLFEKGDEHEARS